MPCARPAEVGRSTTQGVTEAYGPWAGWSQRLVVASPCPTPSWARCAPGAKQGVRECASA
eukprot:8663605-Alexandrium_andersonii.AAC.1